MRQLFLALVMIAGSFAEEQHDHNHEEPEAHAVTRRVTIS